MNTIIVKVNNKVETVAEHTVVLKDETPTVIKAVNRTNYELLDTTVNRAPNNVVTKRVDKNLHISFENDGQGPDLIIEGFYDNADSALIGIAEDGSYYYYLPDTGDVTDYVTELQMGEAQSQSLAGDAQISPWWVGATEAEGFAALPWLLGLAGVGVAAAALGGGGSGDNSSAPVDTTAPDAPTDIYVGNDDAFINAAEIDDNGKVDIIIGLPGNASVGDIITVNGIKQKLTNDDIENKNVTVKINAPAEGEALDVTASITDAAGNESDELSETVGIVDTVAPGEQEDADPVAAVIVIDEAEDGFVNAEEFGIASMAGSGIQTQVTLPTGTVVGDTVTLTVTPAIGEAITVDYVVTADDLDVDGGNGVAEVTIPNDTATGITADGNYSVTVIVTDAAGNSSATSEAVNFTVDTVAPDAPKNTAIGNGDESITVDEIVNDKVSVTIVLPDNAVVGDTVTVNGIKQELTNDDIENKNITVKINAPAEGEALDVTASIKDAAGNESSSVTTTATRNTIDAPDAPVSVDIGDGSPFITDNEIANNQIIVTVELPDSAEAGDTVVVNGVGEVLDGDNIIVDSNGKRTVTFNFDAPLEGLPFEATASIKDAEGASSIAVTASAIRDTVAPGGEADADIAAPTVSINEAADGVSAIEFGNGVQTQVTLPTGTVVGDTITLTVTPAIGEAITIDYVVTADDLEVDGGNGVAEVTIPNDMDDGITANGDYSVVATVRDAAGNVSETSEVVSFTVDTVAPEVPTEAPVVTDNVVNDGSGGVLTPAETITDGGVTNDNTPSVTVPADQVANGIPQLVIGDDVVASTSVTNDDGSVTLTPTVALEDGNYEISYNLIDAAGNVSADAPTTTITVDTVAPGGEADADIAAPTVSINEAADGVNAIEFGNGVQTQVTLPTGTVVGDTITLTVTPAIGEAITIDYVVTADDLEVDGGNGVAEVTIPNDMDDGITANGDYSVVATVRDAAGNVSSPSVAVDFNLNATFKAQDDSDTIDLGELQVTQYSPVISSDLDMIGIAEGAGGIENSLNFTVSEGANGTVSIEVKQTALVTVADAVNVEVYNSSNQLVYVGTTGGNPLVGNVIGIELLGLTGNDTLTAMVSGLEPDNYTVVVRNDRSTLETLVSGLTLSELGEAGVVLGRDNQELVLNAIEVALNDQYSLFQLGTIVTEALEEVLFLTGELSIDELVSVLQGTLTGPLLGSLIDPALDAVATALLSNTLTLLETTDITAILTEYDYLEDTVITGNVIDPDASSSGESGEDTITVDTVLTNINSNNIQSEPTSEVVNDTTVFTIQGQYGVLVIDENGNYTYTANGDYVSPNQTETFTYTISDGITTDMADLVIDIGANIDTTPPADPTIDSPIAGDDIINNSEATAGFTVTGQGVSGDTITLTDSSNNIIGTAIVDTNGNWSIGIDKTEVAAMGQGDEQLTATATDPSGNVSNPIMADINIDTVLPMAVDDQNSASIDITKSSPILVNDLMGEVSSLISLGVLGELVKVNLLGNSTAFVVDVAADTEQNLTISGTGGLAIGVDLGSDRNLDLMVYKQNVNSTEAELVQVVPNWLGYKAGGGFIGLGGTWTGTSLELDTLSGGAKYYIVVGNGSGLLNLGLGSSVTITTDTRTVTTINIDAQETFGNVLTNDTDKNMLTVVSYVDGIPVIGETNVIGQYGSLAINPDGTYTYTPNENDTVVGQTDEFEYTVDNGNGNVNTATLSINIDNEGAEPVAARSMMVDESFTLADDTDYAIELPDISFITSTEGLDILSFDGANQVISLSDLIQPEVLEIIDISGIGANTLNVAANDVDSTIYVKGDSDDTVNLEGDSWSNVEQTTSGGEVYNVWQSADDVSTQIYIDNNVNII